MSDQNLTPETSPNHNSQVSKSYTHLLVGISLLNTLAILTVGTFLYLNKQAWLQNSILHTIALENSSSPGEDKNYGIPLDYFLVNLAEDNGLRQFKVQMEFKVDNPEVLEEINQRMPQIRDTNIILLSSMNYRQIASAQGKVKLKEEIRSTVNSYLTKGKISKVLFTNFIYN